MRWGLTAILLIFAIGAASGAPIERDQMEVSSATSGQASPPSVVATEPTVERGTTLETDWRKPTCDEPKSHSEADLCEQRRMAKAAEDAVVLNKVQIGIGILTIFGLIFTVHYTRKTAKAAVVAADATKAAAEHVPNVERAVIYGGIGFTGTGIENGVQCIKVQISMANYGRTPGFVKHIETGSCTLTELPDEPFYTDCFAVSDLYFPEMTLEGIRPTPAIITIPGDGNHVVFQRVYYDDIFGNQHFSGSVYRLWLDGPTIRTAVVRKPAYWERD